MARCSASLRSVFFRKFDTRRHILSIAAFATFTAGSTPSTQTYHYLNIGLGASEPTVQNAYSVKMCPGLTYACSLMREGISDGGKGVGRVIWFRYSRSKRYSQNCCETSRSFSSNVQRLIAKCLGPSFAAQQSSEMATHWDAFGQRIPCLRLELVG